jgi:hypothetical protein
MLDDYIMFYYGVKELKKHGLRLDFNNSNLFKILRSKDESYVCSLNNLDQFLGFVSSLRYCGSDGVLTYVS